MWMWEDSCVIWKKLLEVPFSWSLRSDQLLLFLIRLSSLSPTSALNYFYLHQLMEEQVIFCVSNEIFNFFLANHFVCILDVCLSSPLYTPQQKQLYNSWKQKIRAIWSSSPFPLTPNSYVDSLGYSPKYVPRRYSLNTQTQMIRQFSPVRTFLSSTKQATFHHRSSVPNIKFGYPTTMSTPQPHIKSVQDDEKADSALDNIETQLENICLSVTNQVIDKEES